MDEKHFSKTLIQRIPKTHYVQNGKISFAIRRLLREELGRSVVISFASTTFIFLILFIFSVVVDLLDKQWRP